MRTTVRRHLGALVLAGLVVLGSMAMLALTREPQPGLGLDLTALRSDDVNTGIWEIFFSVFGLIYAIVVGLFIVEAQRRIIELATAVQAELNAIGDIDDFLKYFEETGEPTEETARVRSALLGYAKNEVVDDLSPEKRGSSLHTQARRREVAKLIGAVKGLTTHDQNDNFALDAIINRIGHMTSFRAQKMEVARRGFPWPFYALLVFMSAVIILGIILIPVSKELGSLHFALVFVTSVATTALFLLIWDLDRPLRGYWNIHNDLQGDVDEVVGRLQEYGRQRQSAAPG